MKKVISVMLVMIMIVMISKSVFAIDPSNLLGNKNDEGQTTITPDQYQNAQNNNTNNTTNNTNNTSLPQTGIEDGNIGVLLIICIGSAIFAYKKINDYRNI